MSKTFTTGKHLKKQHFIQQIPTTHPQKKIAMLKETIDSSTNHKDKEAVKKSEPTVTSSSVDEAATPPDKSFEINSTTPTAVVSPALTTAPPPHLMAQRTFQLAKKKNAVEKLKDKFHQLINHFKK